MLRKSSSPLGFGGGDGNENTLTVSDKYPQNALEVGG